MSQYKGCCSTDKLNDEIFSHAEFQDSGRLGNHSTQKYACGVEGASRTVGK